jgi:hypothetical protein
MPSQDLLAYWYLLVPIVPIGKSIKFPKIRLSQIMKGENEMVGRQKVFLINSNLMLIAYQTFFYILKPTLHFPLDQTGHSLTLIGDIATQKLHVGIIPDACHSIIPMRHCGRQGSRVGMAVQTAWQQDWLGNMAGATHGWKGGRQGSRVGVAVGTVWQRGRRGNTAGMTCGRQGTVVGRAAGLAWMRGLRGSGAGVATWLALHAAGKALWSTRQKDRCDTKVGES